MNKPRRRLNLFYAVSIVVGLAFTITACAFGVLMVKSMDAGGLPEPGRPGYALMHLLDQHGMAILGFELLLLAAATVAAISLDHVRDRREYLLDQQRAAEQQRNSVALQPQPQPNDPAEVHP